MAEPYRHKSMIAVIALTSYMCMAHAVMAANPDLGVDQQRDSIDTTRARHEAMENAGREKNDGQSRAAPKKDNSEKLGNKQESNRDADPQRGSKPAADH